MAASIDLDHVALAAETWGDLWPRYAGDLGGRWLAGGTGPGFGSAQIRFSNGMKLEALAPHQVEVSDFLRRFLDANGPGPHHLTFKVADIICALDRASANGYRPVGVDLRDPRWKEAFLHPKDAPGVVVQLAQAASDWASPEPPAFPLPRRTTASLDHVAHGVADLAEGIRLFVALLDGEETGRGHDDLLEADWVDLCWPGPGRIRLLRPSTANSPVRAWIATRAGRIHHLALTVVDPAGINDARETGDSRYEIAPNDNLGTRLLISARST